MFPGKLPVLSLLMLLLSACAGLDQTVQPTQWDTHKARIAGLEQWTASGKLALRSGETAESVSLVWRQLGAQTDLTLSGPLGVGATSIHSDGRKLIIHRDEQTHELDISTPDALYDSTGWDLPLQALVHWIRGLPAPDATVELMEFDPASGLLRQLRQDDWDIHYEDYKAFDGFTLPRRLKLTRGETRVKVIFANWRVGTG